MTVKKITKPFDPFEVWRKNHLNKRDRYVRIAFNALNSSEFSCISKLAESVAKIVTQFEFKDAGVTEKTDKVKGCDSSTILSLKSKYRDLLVAEWAMRQGVQDENKESISELEVTKIRCVNLAHQNELLLKSLEQMGQPVLPIDINTRTIQNNKDIGILIEIILGMFGEVSELFTTVMEGDEDGDHPVAGLYGPNGFVVGIEALRRFKEIQDERKA